MTMLLDRGLELTILKQTEHCNDAGTANDVLLIPNLLIATRSHDSKHNTQLLERLDNLRRVHEELTQ